MYSRSHLWTLLILVFLTVTSWTADACEEPCSQATAPCRIEFNSTVSVGSILKTFDAGLSITLSDCENMVNITDNNELMLLVDVNVKCQKTQPFASCQYECTSDPGNIRHLVLSVTYIDTTPPQFNSEVYTVRVLEEIGNNTEIFSVKDNTTVIDPDCNDAVHFQMSDPKGFFYMPNEGSGLVATKKSIDYEKPDQREFNLTIIASNRQTANATLRVIIQDIDDNAPKYNDSQYTLNVTEEQLTDDWLSTDPPLACHDQDSGINAAVKYAFLVNGSFTNKNGSFQIDETSGKFKLLQKYDRETLPVDALTVWCYQYGNRSQNVSTMLTINVIDVNDNLPVFNPVSYDTTVNENTVGYILTVSATDKDVGENGQFVYEIPEGDGTLTIDQQTGVITVPDGKILDREKTPIVVLSVFDPNNKAILETTWTLQYQFVFGSPVLSRKLEFNVKSDVGIKALLKVRAVDIAGNYSNTTVTITLSDLNDNSPKFTHERYAMPFNSTENGRFVGQVSAIDADDTNTGNANVTYNTSLSWVSNDGSGNVPLALDSLTGTITVEGGGSIVPGQEYNLIVNACDNPAEKNDRRCTTVPVVSVYNPNATGVLVDISQTMNVPENVPVGTLIGRLKLTGHYYETNMSDSFDVDQASHMLRTKIDLDRETRDIYDVSVSVTSRSLGYLGVVNILVQVTDINDHSPKFEKDVYYFNLPVGETRESLGTLNATDADIGENGNVSYSFYPESQAEVFQLDKVSGEIRLEKDATQSVYKLMAVASDQGKPSRSHSVPVYITHMEIVDEAVVTIIVTSSAAYIMDNKDYFQSKMAKVLGFSDVTITAANDVMSSRSAGLTLRSKISFKASNGTSIASSDLHMAVINVWTGIQDLFRQPLVPFATSDEGLHPAEIALIAVAVVMLVGGAICIFVVCKQFERHVKNLQLYDHLSRRGTMYDSQELRMDFAEEATSQPTSRISTFRGNRGDVADTELEGSFGVGYINTAFTDDEGSVLKTPTWSTSGTPRVPKWSTSDSLKDAMDSLEDLASRLNAEDNISRVTSMSRSRRSVKSEKSDTGEVTLDMHSDHQPGVVYANVAPRCNPVTGDNSYITPIVDYPVDGDDDDDQSALKYDQMDLTMSKDDDTTGTVINGDFEDIPGGIAASEGYVVEEATAF